MSRTLPITYEEFDDPELMAQIGLTPDTIAWIRQAPWGADQRLDYGAPSLVRAVNLFKAASLRPDDVSGNMMENIMENDFGGKIAGLVLEFVRNGWPLTLLMQPGDFFDYVDCGPDQSCLLVRHGPKGETHVYPMIPQYVDVILQPGAAGKIYEFSDKPRTGYKRVWAAVHGFGSDLEYVLDHRDDAPRLIVEDGGYPFRVQEFYDDAWHEDTGCFARHEAEAIVAEIEGFNSLPGSARIVDCCQFGRKQPAPYTVDLAFDMHDDSRDLRIGCYTDAEVAFIKDYYRPWEPVSVIVRK